MVLELGIRESGPASADAALVEVARGAPAAFYQFRRSPSGVYSISLASRELIKLVGIEPGDPIQTAALFISRIHPDDWPGVENAISRSARTVGTFECEFRLRLPSGAEFWVETRANPRPMPAGGMLWNGIVTDITSRKQAEEALRESESRFRTLFQTTTFGVVSQDRDRKIVLANYAAERILGLGEGQLLALTSDDPRWQALYEDGTPVPRDSHPASVVLRTGKAVRNFVMGVWNPALGRHVWLRASAMPEFRPGESGPFRVWISFEDITERKKAAEALAASETRYRVLFENAAEGIIAIDPESGQFQFFNPTICSMFGYSPEEFGKLTLADVHPKEALAHVIDGIQAAVAGMSPSSASVPCVRKDGTSFVADIRGSVAEVAGRKVSFGFFTDVSERLRLEEQLRQAQTMDAIGQLAGGVAHGFNNLLTVISGNTELLLLETGAEDPKRGALTDIRKASERAASLTRQLLAFSRKQVLEPRLVDVHLVIAGIEAMLRRLAGENTELATDYAASSSWVKVDPGQLEDVVVNLALNARDAMPCGGRVTIRTWNLETAGSMELEETAGQKSRPKVAISISDTGSGIPPELKGRVFEPFFTTKTFGEGSGLGLATVHGIVKQSGGEIVVESEPGKGSTFTVVLPSRPAPRPHSGSSPSLRALPRGSETILVVEDEEAVRRIVTTTLGSTGYRILEARNGVGALEAARRHGEAIHLVVTDVVMPGMGGREMVEQLVKDRPGIRVLYMSGYANDAVTPHGFGEPGIAFLQKPFLPLTLARKVREVLDAAKKTPAV